MYVFNQLKFLFRIQSFDAASVEITYFWCGLLFRHELLNRYKTYITYLVARKQIITASASVVKKFKINSISVNISNKILRFC